MSNAGWDLQKAIVARWAADAWLSGHGKLYFERAPGTADFPYAVFMVEGDAKRYFGGTVMDYRVQFNVFSKLSSSQEVNDFLEAIKVEFAAALAVAGRSTSGAMRLESEHPFENDSQHWQGVLVFTVRVQ